MFKESFLLQNFFEKTKSKDVASMKTQKTDIIESVSQKNSAVCSPPQSLTPRWDAHCEVFKKFEYLSEIETDFENILASLSGA